MKILKKLLLINWHYFTHQLIEFEQLNYMTGVNASGKSTIIDALQLVLLGDTRGNYFNKSASGKSARTLSSYLCGEISDNSEGGFKYLRNGRFTSYVVTEFYDDEKCRSLTFGGIFDVHSPNDTINRFFKYIGVIPENHFIENGIPYEIQKLREYLKTNEYRDVRFYESGVSYREDIYALLGALRQKFMDLLKKAVAFNPDNNIQKFITEFVCDSERAVDVAPMQANIRSYKNLERTAAELEKKKSALEKISACFSDYEKSCENEKTYKYLILKSEIQMLEEMLNSLIKKAEIGKEELENIKQNLEFEKENFSILSAQYSNLKTQLDSDKTEIRLKEIDKQTAELKQKIHSAKNEFDKVVAQIYSVKTLFSRSNNEFINRYNSVDLEKTDCALSVLLESVIEISEKLSNEFDFCENLSPKMIIEFTKEKFSEIILLINNLKENATLLYSRLIDETMKNDEKLRELNAEKSSLEKGKFKFPQNALDLKQAIISQIKAKTGQNAEVVLVAEAAEIKNDRWRNAIEGYLNNQKFYIIVPPEFVKLAIRVFDRIRRDRAVYDTGIVDIEKITRKNPIADQNSLATEIDTPNQYVRIYLDYLLGRVMKCDSAENIRNYPISITNEGLLYKNYVVRAINPRLWRNPAIGQNAIAIRLEEIKVEITQAKELIRIYSLLKAGVEGYKNLDNYSKNDIERYSQTAENFLRCADFQTEISELEKEKASLDTGNLNVLKEKVAMKKLEVKESDNLKAELQSELGTAKEKLRSLTEEKIPHAENELIEKRDKLADIFTEEWITDVGEPRYLFELSKRGEAKLIFDAFPRELSRAKNSITKFRESLVSQRTDYNYRFKMGYNVNEEDNSEFDDALKEINENTLPDYLTRIEDTKKKAMEEFQEDFLSKLSDNIRSVKREIKELNNAISSASFGDDTYSFKVEPNKNYERFYRMITDEMLMSGYTLMSNQFNEKYRGEINELFSVMTGEGNTSLDQSDYEKSVRLFTDYRTYLSFDIEVKNKDGEVQRLSRTIDKKSGGETQTPFYIAVLASFAQLYRMGRDKKANTARLIIFDEAFSKMDGERIEKSIMLLRKIGFQVILSTPTEKAGDIAPWVDRVLLVLRKGRVSQVTYFDKERVGELIDE